MTKFIDLTLNGISDGAIYAAVALALVLIWRATRIVNFAQGAMLMITTFIAYAVITSGFLCARVRRRSRCRGLVLGAVDRARADPAGGERSPLNAVIVTLGLYTLLVAVAGMIWGNSPLVPARRSRSRGYKVGGTRAAVHPQRHVHRAHRDRRGASPGGAVPVHHLGLQMRAAAFAPKVARLLGVRVGRMFTLGWAFAALVGALAGVLVAPSVFLGPNSFDPILISGFVAAVFGGLDSPPGAVIGRPHARGGTVVRLRL